MSSSRLDQVERISPNFNVSADVLTEKRASQYQLTPEEQQARFDLSKTRTEQTQQERQSFNSPEEFKKRFDEKYADLVDKHGTAKLEYTPPGMGGPIPRHQLLQMADVGVRNDHQGRLKGFETDYQKGLNTILDRAAQEGRGPKPQDQSQDQNRTQQNDRNADRDRDRDH